MRITALAVLITVFDVAGVAQQLLEDNTLTVTSARPISIQADQVALAVNAVFEASADLDDVVAAVRSAGITAANLTGINSNVFLNPIGTVQTNQWTFQISVPFSKLNDRLSTLAALQQSIGRNSPRNLLYYAAGTATSAELQASAACPYSAIFLDAAASAKHLASAAGLMLGSVLAISDGSTLDSGVVPSAIYDVPVVAYRSGDFASILLTNQLLTAPRLGSPCTLIVQFKLIH